MLGARRGVFDLDVGEGVCAAAVAHQQRVALAEVARVLGSGTHAHQSAVGIVAAARRDALADNGRLGVAAQVDHFGAGVGLLAVVGYGYAVKLAHAVVALEDAARVLPGHGAAGFDLGPADFGVRLADSALGHKIVDPALAFGVARVPVLHRGVLDFGAVQGHELHHRRVQLVFVALRRGAALEVADVAPFVGHQQRALELARSGLVDAEVGAQLHRAAHALGDVAKRAVGEHGAVQGRIEVVGLRNHRSEVLFNEFGVLQDGLAHRTKNDALLGEGLLEGRCDRHGIYHDVHGHAAEALLLVEADAQLFKGFKQLRVDLIKAVYLLFYRCRVVADRLKIGLLVVHVGPFGLGHLLPHAVGVEAPLGHPLGLVLFGTDGADHVFAQARWHPVGRYVGVESVFVFRGRNLVEQFVLAHFRSYTAKLSPQPQVRVALGLLNAKPLPFKPPLYSNVVPSR